MILPPFPQDPTKNSKFTFLTQSSKDLRYERFYKKAINYLKAMKELPDPETRQLQAVQDGRYSDSLFKSEEPTDEKINSLLNLFQRALTDLQRNS